VKTCATCRFMGAKSGIDYLDASGEDSEHRSCARIIHGNGYDFAPGTNPATEPAVVTDGSGYSARLCVLPSFGCVLHEEKGGGAT
jgi:hypothetical protein